LIVFSDFRLDGNKYILPETGDADLDEEVKKLDSNLSTLIVILQPTFYLFYFKKIIRYLLYLLLSFMVCLGYLDIVKKGPFRDIRLERVSFLVNLIYKPSVPVSGDGG